MSAATAGGNCPISQGFAISESADQVRQVRRLGLRSRSNRGIAAGKEHERCVRSVRSIDVQDAADHDPVVAALVDRLDRTPQSGPAPVETRPAYPLHERE